MNVGFKMGLLRWKENLFKPKSSMLRIKVVHLIMN